MAKKKQNLSKDTSNATTQTENKNVDLKQRDGVQNNTPKNENPNQELHIVIQRHKQLYETLNNRKRVINAGCLLSIFLVVLFACFTVLSIAIKDRIPYHAVMSNEFGVFEMRNEKADQFYFLFNSAELWGNSGIMVHKGEHIIIKASGKFNTEVRHMAFKDSIISWIDANGRQAERSPNTRRDIFLFKNRYMLYPEAEPECLLAMIESDNQKLKNWQEYYLDYNEFMSGHGPIKVVGTNCEFIAENDGFLLFAVNDVVFTDSIVNKLNQETDQSLDSLKYTLEKVEKSIAKTEKSERDQRKHIGLERMWFNDNVGSFLIFIERFRAQDKSE